MDISTLYAPSDSARYSHQTNFSTKTKKRRSKDSSKSRNRGKSRRKKVRGKREKRMAAFPAVGSMFEVKTCEEDLLMDLYNNTEATKQNTSLGLTAPQGGLRQKLANDEHRNRLTPPPVHYIDSPPIYFGPTSKRSSCEKLWENLQFSFFRRTRKSPVGVSKVWFVVVECFHSLPFYVVIYLVYESIYSKGIEE